MAATPAYFLGPDGRPRAHSDAVPGGLSVGVPGNLRLDRACPRAPWPPALGAPVRARDPPRPRRLRDHAAAARDPRAGRTRWRARPPGAAPNFTSADGEPKPVGTILRNPALAAMLRADRRARAGLFLPRRRTPRPWSRPRAARRATRPMIQTGDLAAYDAKERPAVCATYRVYRICGMGPPSSGATTVFAILKQLERFDLAALGPRNPGRLASDRRVDAARLCRSRHLCRRSRFRARCRSPG